MSDIEKAETLAENLIAEKQINVPFTSEWMTATVALYRKIKSLQADKLALSLRVKRLRIDVNCMPCDVSTRRRCDRLTTKCKSCAMRIAVLSQPTDTAGVIAKHDAEIWRKAKDTVSMCDLPKLAEDHVVRMIRVHVREKMDEAESQVKKDPK